MRRPNEVPAAAAQDRDYWMSPLTRIRDLKSYVPRQRSGLVESDSDACNSFDEPEGTVKQPTHQTPGSSHQQQPLLSPPLTDANCNSSSTDKITTTSPCSTFLPPSNALPRESNASTAHDNQCNPGNQDFGRPTNNQQNGNWEKANGNQNENYHYPSGTTDGPGSGNEEMSASSPWRRSWDVESNAQSDGGTTTSGSYMVDQDEMTSVYSSNTFIV